jgi:hypothetical protein
MFKMHITVLAIIILHFRIWAIFVANKLFFSPFLSGKEQTIVNKEIYKHGYLDLYKLTQLL